MRAEQADVVVIGAGLAGSAAAWALAGRGRSVVLLEAFHPGHRHGSSHGSARIFRRAYPDPLYVRLTGQAQVLWRRLADEAGEEFVTTTGAVDYGPAREQEKMYEILTGFGVPAELMDGRGGGRTDGLASRSAPTRSCSDPDGGVIDPERAMAAMRALAAARAARRSATARRSCASRPAPTVPRCTRRTGRGALRSWWSPRGRGWSRCSAGRCRCRRWS